MTRISKRETYLSPKDAQRLTQLSQGTLSRCVRHGLLTHYRTTGGHRRYALSELRELLAARERQAK